MNERTRAWWEAEPADPDIAPASRAVRPGALLGVISAGGVLGALLRYAAGQAWPTPPGSFAWTTLLVNAAGCLLMGVLMVLVAERFEAHPLLRPFVGTGVLGGFTTFSTYAVDTQGLLDAGHLASGLGYALLTILVAVGAVWVGVALTRRVVL